MTVFWCSLLTITLLIFSVGKTQDCRYNGDICDLSAKCLGKLYNDDDVVTCPFMSYPTLYETRGAAEFWIQVAPFASYDKNAAFTIVHEYEGSWLKIKDCCSLKLGETCILPPLTSGSYHIFGRRRHEFCHYDIYDFPAVNLKWRFLDDERGSLYIENGIIRVDEKSEYRNNELTSIDYRFFEVPSDVVSLGDQEPVSGLMVNIPGIKGDEDHIYINNRVVAFTTLYNTVDHDLLKYFQKNKANTGNSKCAFYRLNRFDVAWSKTPICEKGKIVRLSETFSNEKYVSSSHTPNMIIAAVVAAVLLVIFVIILTLVIKRKVTHRSCDVPGSEKNGVADEINKSCSSRETNCGKDYENVESECLMQNGKQSLV